MGVGFREDINSVLMTAMQGLLDKYNIDPAKIGRLEVQTFARVCSVEYTLCMYPGMYPGMTNITRFWYPGTPEYLLY